MSWAAGYNQFGCIHHRLLPGTEPDVAEGRARDVAHRAARRRQVHVLRARLRPGADFADPRGDAPGARVLRMRLRSGDVVAASSGFATTRSFPTSRCSKTASASWPTARPTCRCSIS